MEPGVLPFLRAPCLFCPPREMSATIKDSAFDRYANMKVNEIFCSIQGESSSMGWPCIFIRLTGCNLRCTYCDTEYAFYEGTEMSAAEILEAIAQYTPRLVLVTGGEPMLQQAVHELFAALLQRGYAVSVETGGQVLLEHVDPRIHKVMDLKCPSSGMMPRNDYGNIRLLSRNDEVKFVVGDRADFEWACDTIRSHNLQDIVGTVLFSPVYGKLPYEMLARWVMDCGLNVRMQLQMHRVIWPEINRGV
jgi:7-carboxy-7-deazaguanine synthase